MRTLIALTLSAPLAVSQEEKENPVFKYWSNCKAGSWVKSKMEREQDGKKIETAITTKLLELSDDKAVVEESGKTKFGDREVATPTYKREIKAKEAAGKYKIERAGDEEIEVGGKKLSCRWSEVTMTLPNDKSAKMKLWMSKEIPGGVAKMEMTSQEGQPVKMVAVEWEKK